MIARSERGDRRKQNFFQKIQATSLNRNCGQLQNCQEDNKTWIAHQLEEDNLGLHFPSNREESDKIVENPLHKWGLLVLTLSRFGNLSTDLEKNMLEQRSIFRSWLQHVWMGVERTRVSVVGSDPSIIHFFYKIDPKV